MSGVSLDPSVIDALDLHPGEGVVWASVQSESGERLKPVPKKNWLRRRTLPQLFIIFAVSVLMFFAERLVPDTSLGALLYSFGLVSSSFSGVEIIKRYWLSTRWGKRYVSFGPYAFLSCVITDQRVLFFDLPGETPVSVARNQLAKVVQGFSEGAQALLFYPRDFAVEYAFISTSDFTPALRALDR